MNIVLQAYLTICWIWMNLQMEDEQVCTSLRKFKQEIFSHIILKFCENKNVSISLLYEYFTLSASNLTLDNKLFKKKKSLYHITDSAAVHQLRLTIFALLEGQITKLVETLY